ncbi:MAG: DUF4294 domain-containing protein, partial [Bacteroidota bacterium]
TFSVSIPREFENPEDYKLYRKYKRYAVKVYPYAVEAIRIFREVEYATANMKKRERKRYIKKLNKQLKEEFKDPLKKLSKTQGKILIKMIERELDQTMHRLIKDLRGGWSAGYYTTLGFMFGHRLKHGYIEGEDPILDAVLQDLDVSYEYPAPVEDRKSVMDDSEDEDMDDEEVDEDRLEEEAELKELLQKMQKDSTAIDSIQNLSKSPKNLRSKE